MRCPYVRIHSFKVGAIAFLREVLAVSVRLELLAKLHWS